MSRLRRCTIALFSLGLAFVLFHGQLAAAVVTRGDDALHLGDVAGALRLYERAVILDSRSAIAADRLAFTLTMHHERANADRAIAVVTRALQAGANDATLYADRAFAEVQVRRWHDAERDFAVAGAATNDPRYDHFAARMALRDGDPLAARQYTQLALAADPSFAPARAFARRLH